MDKPPTKGPICGIENCRSRRYDEGEDGFLYCENGHRQGGLVRGEDDEENFTPAARTVTRKRKEVDESTEKGFKHFSGRQGLDLYLKCLQLILRHQIWFLVHEKGLPAELETVIYDLWTLRITQLGDKIASSHSESNSQTQSQLFSTLETDDSNTTDNGEGLIKKRNRGKEKLAGVPNLNDALALCYLGILTLRLQVTPGDLCAWVTEDKMAYRRAIRLVPLAMRDRLPAKFHGVLDYQYHFKHQRFYDTVTDLQLGFSKDFCIVWPNLNVPLLLYRFLRELALPLDLYDATIRLADLLGYNFAQPRNGKQRLGIRHLPEAQLAGCFVVSLKLLYPLENRERFPKTSRDPSATSLNWDDWCRRISRDKTIVSGQKEEFTTDQLSQLQEKDVFSMSHNQIDQYLDFYADTFLVEKETEWSVENNNFRYALYEMFPIKGNSPSQPQEETPLSPLSQELAVVKAVQSCITPVPAVSDDATTQRILRPGEAYLVWRKAEDLPNRAQVLYEQVAGLVGLSVDMLVLAVFFTEARIEQWRRQQVRQQADGREGTQPPKNDTCPDNSSIHH